MKSSSLSLSVSVASATDTESSPASWGRLVASSVRAAVAVMLVGGIAYPLATTGVAQALLPYAANGSLVERNGLVMGSALIGQQFAGASYFHGRPSATVAPDPDKEGASIAVPYNAAQSGGSNQGGTHKDLAEAVAARVAQYRADNALATDTVVPVDAVTASASGLDPHISVANALVQVPRVAQARKLTPDQVRQMVAQSTQGRTFGLLGEPRVNVLRLNLSLGAQQPAAKE